MRDSKDYFVSVNGYRKTRYMTEPEAYRLMHQWRRSKYYGQIVAVERRSDADNRSK